MEILSTKEPKSTDLHYIIVGGEPLSKDVYEKIFRLSGCHMYNAYGPTECSIMATGYDTTGKNITTLTVPIGSPVANTQVYVLDTSLNPIPVGMPGELYIGGEGLARGYLNRPELTTERFIKNPFQTEEEKAKQRNDRLYKTGDLVHWLEDGNIEYIGRIDDQVKIRGFRIELGEIESTLLTHPEVKQIAVIAREDVPGDKRLVAYVVYKEKPIEFNTLATFLKGSLPGYMVPSAFVTLEALPVTSNGKLDHKALPAPEYQGREEEYIAPRTVLEERLCEIWQEVLKVERVGIADNFFRLGGHSLLATQLVSRLRKNWQIELPLKVFFTEPTVEALARSIEGEQKEENTIPLLPVAREGRLPLSFAQQRLWFIEELMPNSALYNIPTAWKLKGRLSYVALEAALNSLIARHEVLRTVFKVEENNPYQFIYNSLTLDIPLIDLSSLRGKNKKDKAQMAIQEEALKPFDLTQGPLIRATLIKLREDEHILVLNIHHSVSDGWSLGVIIQELVEVYNATLNHEVPNLKSLPIQYADFAVWQRAYLAEDSIYLQKQLAYWTEKLADVPNLLELPTDYLRPAIQSFRGSRVGFRLPLELSAQLKALSEENSATLYMTMLAAFFTLLYRYTNQEDIVVGSPIANRNRQEIEGLVGFFVNALVLRANLSSSVTFKELLQQVKETTLDAYDHQDLPFERLVDSLNIERSLSYSPLFQVMFVLQNADEGELKLRDVSVEPMTFDYPIAKFELTLALFETKEGIEGGFEYATDLFKPSTIERMFKHYHNLLEEITKDPNKQLSQFEMLSPEEKQQILIDWNQTDKDYPKDKTIHQLFEEQTENTPNNTAVIFEDQCLTYEQLNVKANQLAHYLIKHGVKPDTLVAIICERSFDMIVGMLGILKAGGAYVPIDPFYPQEYVQFMLEDTQAPIILTQQDVLKKLPQTKAKVFLIDNDREKLTKYPHSNPLSASQSHHLAYVIYTSGSTGKPKGVMIDHKNVCNRLQWVREYFPVSSNDAFLHQFPFSFDASVIVLWRPIISGAKVIVPSTLDNYEYLINLICTHKI